MASLRACATADSESRSGKMRGSVRRRRMRGEVRPATNKTLRLRSRVPRHRRPSNIALAGPFARRMDVPSIELLPPRPPSPRARSAAPGVGVVDPQQELMGHLERGRAIRRRGPRRPEALRGGDLAHPPEGRKRIAAIENEALGRDISTRQRQCAVERLPIGGAMRGCRGRPATRYRPEHPGFALYQHGLPLRVELHRGSTLVGIAECGKPPPGEL
jgi:hypothetical protein